MYTHAFYIANRVTQRIDSFNCEYLIEMAVNFSEDLRKYKKELSYRY
jgi:hypothetical protein